MIIFNYKTDTYSIKNGLDEFTIKEFEDISKILNETDKEPELKWVETFAYLGIPADVLADLKPDDYKNLMEALNFAIEEYPIPKDIEIDGVTCTSYKTNFKITVKEAILIDEYIRKDNHHYLAEVLAILYKSPYMLKDDNYDKKTIKTKSKYIRENITADVAFPILNYIITKMINRIPNE